jgi:hypothetical protein
VGRYSESSSNLINQIMSTYPNCKILISSFDKYRFHQYKNENIVVIDSNLKFNLLPNYMAQQKLIMQTEKLVDSEYVLKIRTDLLDIAPLHWIEKGLYRISENPSRIVVTQFFLKILDM